MPLGVLDGKLDELLRIQNGIRRQNLISSMIYGNVSMANPRHLMNGYGIIFIKIINHDKGTILLLLFIL